MERVPNLDADARLEAWEEERVLVRRLFAWRAAAHGGRVWVFHATSESVAMARAQTLAGSEGVAVGRVPDLAVLLTMRRDELVEQAGYVFGRKTGRRKRGTKAGKVSKELEQWVPGADARIFLEGAPTVTRAMARCLAHVLALAQEWPSIAPDLEARGRKGPVAGGTARRAMEIHGGRVPRGVVVRCLSTGLGEVVRMLPEEQIVALRELEKAHGWTGLDLWELVKLWRDGPEALESARLARGIPYGYGRSGNMFGGG